MSDDNGRPHLRLIGQPTTDSPDGDETDTARTETAPRGSSGRYPAGAWSSLHDLTGRVMLLTGHGDGLDDALATGLADYGARLAIAQRDIERAKRTAQISSRPGGQGSIAFAMDSTRPEQVRRGIGAVEQLTGQLDALVVIVDLGRATASRDAGSGVSLGEMIHLVRAAERRMAVLGGGRILLVAGGTPRDPAVGAITVGAVAEFVRTTAPRFAAQGVTINGIVAVLPVSVLTAPSSSSPPALLAGSGSGSAQVDTVVDSLPQSTTSPGNDAPATVPIGSEPLDQIAPLDEVIDQAPVIPFPTPADAPQPASSSVNQSKAAPVRQPHDYAAATVAAAILFLGPVTAGLSGQVIRIDPAAPLG